MEQRPQRVFISYSHDTVEHQERVLDLADRLRADGIDAEVDQYNAAPPDGWPLWCERQIKAADVVLMVCTETYNDRVSDDEEHGKGLGVVWEAKIIRQLLYDAGAISNKFVPVLFSEASPEHIPTLIKGWTRYVVDTKEGYEDLYRRLTGQPRLLRPALGARRSLPTLRRQQVFRARGTKSPQAAFMEEAAQDASSEDRVGWIQSASNLLDGLLENQFERVLHYLDPQGLVRTSLPNSSPAEEKARRVQELIQLMLQQGHPSADVFRETILTVRSPFSPFNGDTLENWTAKPSASWRVAQSEIVGLGSDPCVFSDLDTPADLRNASLLIWEGLPFRDGVLLATIRLPLLARQGAGGLIMRHIGDRSAVIAVLRQAQPNAETTLELWQRADVRLYLRASTRCPPSFLTQDSCRIALQLQADSAVANVTYGAQACGISAEATLSRPGSLDAGYCGIIKFGNGALILSNTIVTVQRRIDQPEFEIQRQSIYKASDQNRVRHDHNCPTFPVES